MQNSWALWRQSMAMATLMAEANTVMTLRVLGMMGLWNVPRGENNRMVAEKPPAFTESWVGMSRAFWTGKSAETVFNAWARPLTRKARANRKRLSRRR